MMKIKLWINDRMYEKEIENDMLLIDLVRELGYLSVKRGCDTANCGLCTVWLEGIPVLSCATLAVRAHGKHVTTLEGLEKEVEAFAQFMANEGAEQCGYCSPGLVMNVLAMKKEYNKPTQEEIKHYLAGNLCRCTGYVGQMRAIEKFLQSEEA